MQLFRSPAVRTAVRGVVSFGTLAVGVVFQLISTLLLARVLGAAEFGMYSIYTAVIVVFIEFAGLGTGDFLTVRVSVAPKDIRIWFSSSLLIGLSSCFLLSIPVWFLVVKLVPDLFDLNLLLVIVVVELASGRVGLLVEQSYIALGRVKFANLSRSTTQAVRFFGLLVFLLVTTNRDLASWLVWQAGLSLIGPGIFLLTMIFGNRPFDWRPRLSSLRQSLPLGATPMLRLLQQNLDRLVLALVLSAAQLGQYAAASRLVMVSLTPVQAYLRTQVAGYYRGEAAQTNGAATHAWKVLRLALPLSLCTVLLSILGLWCAQWILGREYEHVFVVGVWLTPIICLTTLQYVLSDTMAALGLASSRYRITIVSAALSFACLYFFGAIFGAMGAAIAVLLSVSVQIVLFLWAVRRKLRTAGHP